MPRRLTPTFIEKIEPPEQNHKLYFDARVPGLALRVRHNGLKSWLLQYYSPTKRKQHRWTFVDSKDFAKWPIETVVKTAQGFRDQLAEGTDPAEAAAEAANPTAEAELNPKDGKRTVRDLSKKYMEHAKSRPDPKRPSSLKNDNSMLDNLILPRFGKFGVRELTMEDVRELHESVGASTPYRANRMLSLISAMYNYAIGLKWVEHNPARSSYKAKPGFVTRYREEAKENWLKIDRLQQLDKVLGKSDGAEAVRLLALTGARASEVLQAKWSEFDLDSARWNKPSRRTKQGQEHHVPLNPQAIEVIKRVRKHKKSSVYLFPKKGDANQPRTSVKSLWISALHRAGLAEKILKKGKRRKQVVRWKPLVRIHDLRHSFASNLASNNVSLTIVAKLLGHSPKANTVQRYAHISDEAQRETTNRFGAMFANRSKGSGPAN